VVLGGSFWDRHSTWWQQTFTEGADAEYEDQVLPLVEDNLNGARRVLDVGCGEGQVARRMARLGAAVVGIDPSLSQVRTARERGGSSRFVQARAEQLPCVSAAFDTVVVCLALEHVDPFEPAIDEIARVLVPGGRFLLLLTHPLLQAPGSGWIENETSGETFWTVGPYLRDDVAIDEVAPGIYFEFAHRPISRYVHAMGAAGLLIEDMIEPPPPLRVLTETGGFPDAITFPRLMLISARRVSTVSEGGLPEQRTGGSLTPL
jgi:SAM-dependent methyltransferase